jgi:macrolide transport system ATP-binding/permease protein
MKPPGLVLEARGLSKIYAASGKEGMTVAALDRVDLKVQAGEYLAVIGPSGSGKSTLMQVLGLLDRPTSGSLKVFGLDVAGLSDDQLAHLRNRRIGFIFQFFNLLARTRAVDNVALPLLYARKSDPVSRAKALLEKVGLQDRLAHAPHQLSGGQQQRVAIARALANDPALIFADEPTGNISSQHASEVMRELDSLNRRGCTIVLVTHDPKVAAHARRVVTMKDGKILSDRNRRGKGRTAGSLAAEVPSARFHWPSADVLRENLRMGFTALGLNKVRTFLTMLGVIIGVAAVICMTALGNGATEVVKARLASLGSNLLVVLPGNPAANAPGSRPHFTARDPMALKQLVQPGSAVLRVDPVVRGSIIVTAGSKNTSTQILGCEPIYEVMRDSRPVSGRFFNAADDAQRAKVCLLGKTVVKNLYPEGFDPTGSMVKINHAGFRVLGVLPTKGATFQDEDDLVLAPLQTAMHRVLGSKFIHYMDLQASGPDRIDQAVDEAVGALRRSRRLPSFKPDDFQLVNMSKIQAVQTGTLTTLTLLIDSIAALSLGVGGIGIMNIMLVSVRERTKEIGLRKALGARNLEVMFQFLVESLLIGLLGGLLGIALGSLLAGALNWLRDWPVALPWATVAVAVVFSGATGMFFGLWPAWRASRLSPIEALRYE